MTPNVIPSMISKWADQPLPQFDIAHDASAMRSIFQAAMPDQNIHKCKVLNVRYKPGKRWTVSYRLKMAQAGASAPALQILSARFYAPGKSVRRFEQARREALATPAFGVPVFHIPDRDAVVWAFPNDPKLRAVAALIDQERVAREVLPLLMSGASGREMGAGRMSLEVVRYIPEHGCMVKLTAYPDDGAKPVIFYGKTYCADQGQHAYHNMRALWNSEGRTRGALRIAQPLLYEPAHRILWQSAVEGPTLASFENSGPPFFTYLQAAGRAVVALHSQSVPGLTRTTAAQRCIDLQVAESHLRRVPMIAECVSRVTGQLLEEAQKLEPARMATLHSDLDAANVICSDGPAALIDLDKLCAGDPLQDLGSFIASTCARALDDGIGTPEMACMVAALVRGYEESAGWEVPRAALRWHTAAALIAEQAYRAVIGLKIGRLEGLVDVAQAALSGEAHRQVLP